MDGRTDRCRQKKSLIEAGCALPKKLMLNSGVIGYILVLMNVAWIPHHKSASMPGSQLVLAEVWFSQYVVSEASCYCLSWPYCGHQCCTSFKGHPHSLTWPTEDNGNTKRLWKYSMYHILVITYPNFPSESFH